MDINTASFSSSDIASIQWYESDLGITPDPNESIHLRLERIINSYKAFTVFRFDINGLLRVLNEYYPHASSLRSDIVEPTPETLVPSLIGILSTLRQEGIDNKSYVFRVCKQSYDSLSSILTIARTLETLSTNDTMKQRIVLLQEIVQQAIGDIDGQLHYNLRFLQQTDPSSSDDSNPF